jgi:pimeloyl-ACP methyl ester carboxylesterase
MVSALYEPSVIDELGSVRRLSPGVPALLVNARDDRTVRLSDQERWADLLPGAARVVLEDGGHQFLLRSGFAPIVSWLDALPPWGRR